MPLVIVSILMNTPHNDLTSDHKDEVSLLENILHFVKKCILNITSM